MDALIVDTDTLRAIGIRNLLEEQHALSAQIVTNPATVDGVDDSTIFFVTAEAFASQPYYYVPRRERVVLIGEMAAAPLPVLSPRQTEESLLETLDSILTRLGGHGKAAPNAPLSERERSVLRLIAMGRINKEIASELGISFNTVLTHRRNIMEKLGLRSVPALSMYAVMNGLVSQNEI